MGIIFEIMHGIPVGEEEALLRLKERSKGWDFHVYICDDEEKGQMLLSEGKPVIGYEPPGAHLSFHYLVLCFDGVTREYARLVYERAMDIPREILRTRRCIIRELAMSDMDALFELYSKPHVTDFIEPLYSYEKEAGYERDYIRYVYDLKDFGMWMVTDTSGRLIGRIGLEDKGQTTEYGLSLGYIISPEYQRQGLAFEVCSALLEYALRLGEHRFYATIDHRNIPSVRLATKLGFVSSNIQDENGEEIFLLEKW